MTTISPNRQRGRARTQLFSILGVGIVLVILVLLLRNPLASVLWRVGGPLLTARNSSAAAVGNFFSSFNSNYALAAENARLRAALASSSVALLDRNLLYSENVSLKAQLGRADAGQTAPLLATVLLRPPGVPYDTLMIDVGSGSGVVRGDLVSAGGAVYIGTIGNVYATASQVILFSAPGQTFEAVLMNKATTTIAISVAGQGGGSLSAQLSAGIPVEVGDQILLSSLMPHIAATVSAIDQKSDASFKTIFMSLPVAPSSLTYVEVDRDTTLHVQPFP